MMQKARENCHYTQDKQQCKPAVVRLERGAEDEELALKDAERRRAGDRQHHHQEQEASDRQDVDGTAHFAQKWGAEMLLEIAGAEKEKRLGDRVKDHVQH